MNNLKLYLIGTLCLFTTEVSLHSSEEEESELVSNPGVEYLNHHEREITHWLKTQDLETDPYDLRYAYPDQEFQDILGTLGGDQDTETHELFLTFVEEEKISHWFATTPQGESLLKAMVQQKQNDPHSNADEILENIKNNPIFKAAQQQFRNFDKTILRICHKIIFRISSLDDIKSQIVAKIQSFKSTQTLQQALIKPGDIAAVNQLISSIIHQTIPSNVDPIDLQTTILVLNDWITKIYTQQPHPKAKEMLTTALDLATQIKKP